MSLVVPLAIADVDLLSHVGQHIVRHVEAIRYILDAGGSPLDRVGGEAIDSLLDAVIKTAEDLDAVIARARQAVA